MLQGQPASRFTRRCAEPLVRCSGVPVMFEHPVLTRGSVVPAPSSPDRRRDVHPVRRRDDHLQRDGLVALGDCTRNIDGDASSVGTEHRERITAQSSHSAFPMAIPSTPASATGSSLKVACALNVPPPASNACSITATFSPFPVTSQWERSCPTTSAKTTPN